MNDKEFKVEITDVWPVRREVYPLGGIGVDWVANGIGFGELCLYFTNDGKLHADTEHMCSNDDKAFMRSVLLKLIDEVTIDD